MPKYNNFEWHNYRVRIKPQGWRNIARLFPYLSGSYVNLQISAETKDKKDRDFIFTCVFNRFDGQVEHRNVCEPFDYRNQPTHSIKHRFHEYLVTTGEYIIKASISDGKNRSKWKVIANFSVLERDKIVPYIFLTLISLFIGAVLALLVQWIINLLIARPL
ncbi:hypothetical protein ACFLW8_04525 [Chloroflexota bacterium]